MKEMLPLAEGISVIAFDPGETTGFFTWFPNENTRPKHWTQTFDEMVGMAASPTNHFDYLKSDAWVIERFTLYKHKADSKINSTFPECEVIGMLRVAAKRLGIPQIVFQSASEAKGLVDDERLATYGWNLPTPHERDAARHAVYFLSKRYQEEQINAKR